MCKFTIYASATAFPFWSTGRQKPGHASIVRTDRQRGGIRRECPRLTTSPVMQIEGLLVGLGKMLKDAGVPVGKTGSLGLTLTRAILSVGGEVIKDDLDRWAKEAEERGGE